VITKYLNKPDEDLLQISDNDDVEEYGDTTLLLGRTLTTSPSSFSIPYVNTWQYELQSTYK